jgi:copper(I)-binding protein
MRRLETAGLAFGLAFALAAGAAEIRVANGWARPPVGAAANAPAYVDIESDTALTLTGAASPRAAK